MENNYVELLEGPASVCVLWIWIAPASVIPYCFFPSLLKDLQLVVRLLSDLNNAQSSSEKRGKNRRIYNSTRMINSNRD